MRKLKLFLVITTLLSIVTMKAYHLDANAACNAYEVVDIQSNGSQSSIGCYNSLQEASSKMTSYPNGAVKHNASKSPEKFVAATRAVAQSYPFRRLSGSSTAVTMNIYQYADYNVANAKTTYVSSHFEMAYFYTDSFNPSDGTGKAYIGVAGFAGFVNLDQIDIIPLVYIENNISMHLGGNTAPASYEQPYISKSIQQAYFIVEKNGNVNELRYVSYSHYFNSSSNSRVYKANNIIGPAPDWMTVGTRYYSWDMVNFYSDRNYKNKVGTHYNYYMFLPLRSESNITADQINAFIRSKGYTSRPSGGNASSSQSQLVNTGDAFIQGQNQYGTNALIILAMAIHESGYGRSNISINQNNLFGWAAVDSNPGGATAYSSVEHSISEQFAYNIRGYMDITDGRFFGTHIGEKKSGFNVKYASDPYWGIKIASFAYEIDKYAGLVDHNYYEVGMINQYGIPFKSQAADNASTLATSQFGSTYQEEFMVIINQPAANGYTQVMFSNGIRANGSMIVHRANNAIQGAELHLFSRSVAYVKNTYITPINPSKFTANNLPNPIPGVLKPELLSRDVIFKVDAFALSGTSISLSGYAFQYGVSSSSLNNITHRLVFRHKTDESKTKYFDLNDGNLNSGLNTNYGFGQFDYSGATFTMPKIDLSTLSEGNYTIELELIYTNAPVTKTIILNTLPTGTAETGYDFSVVNNRLEVSITRNYEKTLYTRVEVFRWEANDKLYIQGVAALEGVSHLNKDDIKQVLVIFEVKTKKEYRYDLTPRNHEELSTFYFDLGDSGNYYNAWFDAELDLSNLPVGEYQMRIETEVKNETGTSVYKGKKQLINNLAGRIPEIHQLGANTITFRKNDKYLLRYEFSIQKDFYNFIKDTKKPTTRITNFFMDHFTIDSGKLDLLGFAFMYNTNHSVANAPVYSLVLIDANNKIVLEEPLSTTTGQYDVTSNVASGHSYTHCWFEGEEIDLTGLQKGTYQIYIKMELGEYYDLIPYTSNSVTHKVVGSVSGKTFEFVRDTDYYNRVTLVVK